MKKIRFHIVNLANNSIVQTIEQPVFDYLRLSQINNYYNKNNNYTDFNVTITNNGVDINKPKFENNPQIITKLQPEPKVEEQVQPQQSAVNDIDTSSKEDDIKSEPIKTDTLKENLKQVEEDKPIPGVQQQVENDPKKENNNDIVDKFFNQENKEREERYNKEQYNKYTRSYKNKKKKNRKGYIPASKIEHADDKYNSLPKEVQNTLKQAEEQDYNDYYKDYDNQASFEKMIRSKK